jgi:hypothetical protein
MSNVSPDMRLRAVIVATLGVLLGTLAQASLSDAPTSPRANRLAGDTSAACAAPAGQRLRSVLPARSQVVEIAGSEVRTASE